MRGYGAEGLVGENHKEGMCLWTYTHDVFINIKSKKI